jgi:membrane fusion protein (multidrug efflux system)
MATENKGAGPRKIIVRVVLLALVGLGVWYGISAFDHARHFESTNNAQIETYLVPVLPRVAGYVKAVNMKDYDPVKRGQLLVEIDDDEARLALGELEASYQQALTDVETARANLRNTELTIRSSDANVKLAQIRRDKAQRDAERDQQLFSDKAITRKQAEDTKNALDVQSQQLVAAQTDLAAAQSRVDIQRAALHKAEAQLKVLQSRIDQQKLRLTYTKIYSPAAGRIGRKNVEPGQYVQPGQTLATVVQDSVYWIVANFKETQIERIRVGQPVNITIDGYPDLAVKGTVESFSDATGARFALLPPDNATGNFVKVTQRVPIKITIQNADKLRQYLRAGLSADVEVKVR